MKCTLLLSLLLLPPQLIDQINIKGHPTNAGFLEWAGKLIAETDAHIIQIFRAAGASECFCFFPFGNGVSNRERAERALLSLPRAKRAFLSLFGERSEHCSFFGK